MGASRKIRVLLNAATILILCGLAAHSFAGDRFFVSDKNSKRVFKYDDSFAYNTDWATDFANANPDDVYITSQSVYVLDSTSKKVFRYDYAGGNMVQSKVLKDVGTSASADIGVPVGMSVDPVANEMWVADGNKKLFRFSLSDSFSTGTSVNALNRYNLHNVNARPHGLSLDSSYVYVLDRDQERLYRYPRSNPEASFTPSRKLRNEVGEKIVQPEGMAVAGQYLYVLSNDVEDRVHLYSMVNVFLDPTEERSFVSYPLAAGNTNPFGLGVDKTRSSVSLLPDTFGPTNADSITFAVEFGEPVTNFNDAADLIFTHDGTAHTSITITGSGANYTLTVGGITGDGTFMVEINLFSDVVNSSNLPLIASAASPEVLIDNTVPLVNTLTPLNGSQLDLNYTELNTMSADALLSATYTASGPGLGTLSPTPDTITDLGNNTYRLGWNTGSSIYGQNLTITVDPNLKDEAGNLVDGSNLTPTVTALPVSLSGFTVE